MPDEQTSHGFKLGGESDDLFKSAAEYYAKFRRSCPPSVVSHLVEQFQRDGSGRLLDVGCGTGQTFGPLAKYFTETIAIDADGDMVRHAAKIAGTLSHVNVIQMRAEQIDDRLGSFRMATFGSSFHWMDRQRVSDLIYRILEPDGYLVLLFPGGIHSGITPWESAIREVLKIWLGNERRAGGGIYQQGELHQQALKQTRFENIRMTNIPVREQWTIDQIVGYLFSTSYASPAVLGEKMKGFENSIRAKLRILQPDGQFEKVAEHTIISAQRPQLTT